MVTALAPNAEAGLPARFTLGQVQHYLEDERIPGACASPSSVFICENPSVVETAADVLESRSAPLVCIEGRPSVAAFLLMQEMQNADAVLRYHGDFDWAGLAIAKPLIGAGALPWRFGASDYRDGLARNARLKHLSPPSSLVETPWDHSLAAAMLEQCISVEEETVTEDLLSDLAFGHD